MTGDLTRRAEEWAETRDARLAGRNPWTVAVRTVRSSVEDRVTGLAAEMAFFALLSLVPLVVAVGASLGWLEHLVGGEAVARGREAVLTGLAAVFSREASEDVLRPLVEGLLEEQRGGVALSSVVVALWLASRVFTATIRALDLAYNVEEHRGPVAQRVMAVVFAVLAIVVVSLTLTLSVLGPLLGTAGDIARRLGFGPAFELAWQLGRWPLLVLLAVGYFTLVYRFAPAARPTWRQSLPGAVLGVTLWLAVSAGFHVYLATFGSPTARFGAGEEATAVLGAVGAIVAAVLWTFLSSVALLVGGELNAVLLAGPRERRRPR